MFLTNSTKPKSSFVFLKTRHKLKNCASGGNN